MPWSNHWLDAEDRSAARRLSVRTLDQLRHLRSPELPHVEVMAGLSTILWAGDYSGSSRGLRCRVDRGVTVVHGGAAAEVQALDEEHSTDARDRGQDRLS